MLISRSIAELFPETGRRGGARPRDHRGNDAITASLPLHPEEMRQGSHDGQDLRALVGKMNFAAARISDVLVELPASS
jgi:hypothetical protein